MTFEQWQQAAQQIDRRAHNLTQLIIADARRTAKQAGLDPQMPFLHAHNALCGLEYGHPWPEVNYSLARKVLWLEKKSWEPHRLADKITSRMWDRITKGDSHV